MIKKNILRNVTIEVLNYCNSSCIHCYQNHEYKKQIAVDEMYDLVDQADKAGALQITITGGEPLLHPDIRVIINYIKNKGMAVNLLTSLNLKKRDLKEIALECDKVGVSIYGSNKEIHDSITKCKGSYERMMENLKMLRCMNKHITLNYTMMRQNASDFGNFIILTQNIKIPYRMNYILHGNASKEYQIDSEQIDSRVMEQIRNVNGNVGELSKNNCFLCVAGRSSIWVDVDLDVYPCAFFNTCIGNLRRHEITEIWNNSLVLQRIRSTKYEDFVKCSNCDLRNVCIPCIGENSNESGDITKPSEFCCNIGKMNYQLLVDRNNS